MADKPDPTASDENKPPEGDTGASESAEQKGQAPDTKPPQGKPETGQDEPSAPPPKKPEPVNVSELKLSEGSLLPPSRLERIAADARERGLSRDEAQALVDRESDAVAAHVEAVEAQANTWIEDAKKDPDIAGKDGAQFAQSVELAKRGVEWIGLSELSDMLDSTGLGNHPVVLKAFLKIGRALADDKLVSGTPGGGAKPKTLAERLYPSASK